MHVTLAAWGLTLALISLLLVLDSVRLGRRPHSVGLAEAVRWSLFYIAVAALFGVVFGVISGWQFATQYFAGYVVEKSLSVDNLFVFAIIISAFAVPAEQQPKALTVGIVIALGLRAVFIALGAALLSTFAFMMLIFGLILVATAIQLYRHRDEDPPAQDNALVAVARRILPISDNYDAGRIVTRRGGRRTFTPLLLVLLAIGSSDLLFAFDSIPAVFGVTNHAYIVFAANAFALLGLRPMYFLVSGLLRRLAYLSTGLPAILAFIGAKLILEFAHHQNRSVPTISTAISLAIIGGVLAVTAVASLLKARRDPESRAHAGTLRNRTGSPTEPPTPRAAPAARSAVSPPTAPGGPRKP